MKLSERGYPEEMSGKITLLIEGKEVETKKVEINHPLIYRDIAVYIKNIQSVPQGLSLKSSGKEGYKNFILNTGERQVIGKTLTIAGGRFDPRYGAMEIFIYEKGKQVQKRWFSPYRPRMRSFTYGGQTFTAENVRSVNVGIININKDPGAWIVFAGLSLFALPLTAHLYYRRKK